MSERLAALGAVVLDADKAARAVVEPGTPGLAQIAATFGPGVLAPDGSLDRPKLAEIVFADQSALAKLNAITHPLIHEHIRAAEEAAIQAGGDDLVLVHDIALLAEWGRSKEFDLVIVVDVPTETQVERLTKQRGMPEDQARARIAAQATRDQRLAVADIIIDNSGTRADLDPRHRSLDRPQALRSSPGANRPKCTIWAHTSRFAKTRTWADAGEPEVSRDGPRWVGRER